MFKLSPSLSLYPTNGLLKHPSSSSIFSSTLMHADDPANAEACSSVLPKASQIGLCSSLNYVFFLSN